MVGSSKMRWIVVCLVLSATAPARGQGPESSPPTPVQMIQRLEDYYALFKKCRIEARQKMYITDHELKDELYRDAFCRAWRDGPRWRRKISSTLYMPTGPGKPKQKREDIYEVIMDPDKYYLQVGYDTEKKQPTAAYAYVKDIPFQCWADTPTAFALQPRFFWDDVSLIDVLKQSTLSVQRKVQEGQTLWVLTARGSWGSYEIWLDPGRQWALRRIFQRKRPEDRIKKDGTILKQIKSYDKFDGEHLWTKDSSSQLDVVAYVNKSGRFVPSEILCVTKQVYSNGWRQVKRYTIALSVIDLDPDFSDDPIDVRDDLPDGLPVTVNHERMINYEWRDGKIVKAINASSVANLEGHKFKRKTHVGVGLIVLGCLAAVGVGILVWLRLRRRPAT